MTVTPVRVPLYTQPVAERLTYALGYLELVVTVVWHHRRDPTKVRSTTGKLVAVAHSVEPHGSPLLVIHFSGAQLAATIRLSTVVSIEVRR